MTAGVTEQWRWRLVVLAFVSMGSACAAAEKPANWFRGDMLAKDDCIRRDIKPSDLLTLREIGGMTGTGLSASPDGRYFAFEAHQADIEANSYEVAWFVTETDPNGIPVHVGGGGNPTLFRNSLPDGRVIGAWISPYAKWSPDSRGIAYRKMVDGAVQVWWSPRAGGAAKQLTHNDADVEDFHWSKDGSRLYFTTGANRSDLQQLRERQYRSGYVYDYEMDWSTTDGKPFFPPYELTGSEPRLWVFEWHTGRERRATDEETLELEALKNPERDSVHSAGHRRFTVSGDKLGSVWLQPDDPEKQGIDPPLTLYASFGPTGLRPIRCQAAECTGSFDTDRVLRKVLHWDAVDDEVFFVRKEGAAYSRRTIYAWYPGSQQVRKVLSTDEWLSDCSVTGERAICFRETPQQPRTVVSVDLRDGSLRTLVDPNPGFRCLDIGRVELMEWENAVGHRTFGYLVTPPRLERGKRYPLVFVGYRARLALRGGVGDEYPVHILANNGFVVLVYEKPTAYAARERHSDALDIARARWGRDLFDVRMPLASFKAAIELLSERQLIDPSRVAITGLSNGAAHVNYALIHSNLFAAAIASSCEFAPSGRVLSGASGDAAREYRRAIGAGAYPGPHGFIFPHMSLSLNASSVKTPLLINVSDHEHPWALAEVVALMEAGKPVEMVVYPNEGHIKWQPAHRASVYERNVDWLNFWLQNVQDDRPSKATQYARWHQLRQLWQRSAEAPSAGASD